MEPAIKRRGWEARGNCLRTLLDPLTSGLTLKNTGSFWAWAPLLPQPYPKGFQVFKVSPSLITGNQDGRR